MTLRPAGKSNLFEYTLDVFFVFYTALLYVAKWRVTPDCRAEIWTQNFSYPVAGRSAYNVAILRLKVILSIINIAHTGFKKEYLMYTMKSILFMTGQN